MDLASYLLRAGRMPERLAQRIVWLLLLDGFWMLFVVTTALPELALGAGSAVLALIGVVVLGNQTGLHRPPKLAWLGRAAILLPRLVTDTGTVFGALARQLLRREPALGSFRAVPYQSGQTDAPSAAAADAFVVAANSVTPNTIVLDVDQLNGVVLVHQLAPRSPAATSQDLVRPT